MQLQAGHMPVAKLHMVPSSSAPKAAGYCGLQGCMKSGPVLIEKRFKWYEPDSWRFGDAQVCFAELVCKP